MFTDGGAWGYRYALENGSAVNAVVWSVYSSSTYTERMRLDNLGNLTVNNTITLDGGIELSNSADRSGLMRVSHSGSKAWYGIQIEDSDSGQLFSLMGDNDDFVIFNDTTNEFMFKANANAGIDLYYNNAIKLATTNVGITVTGDGNATDWNATSDARLKDNIRPLEDNPITTSWSMWEWKEDGKTQIGMVAQELEKTHPQFVKEDGDGYKSISYTQVLIAKMAEKDKQVAKLEYKNKQLGLDNIRFKTEIETLAERVDRLEGLLSLTIGLN